MKRRTSSPISNTGGSPRSDCGIMASGSEDAPAAPESSDASEECPGKKKSRFQTFKNFFAKKKKKEAAGPVAESEVQLKSSQSIEDVNVPEPASIHTDKDSDSSSNINVGSKALSQDSVFSSDPPSPETNEALQSSQDSIHGKVKSLQMQLKQAIRLGSPSATISMKKSEDGGVVSEDDGLPCSPPEYSTIHTVLSTSSQRSSGVVQRSGSLSLEGSDSDDDQMSGASSRPGTPQTSIPVDFSEPASSLSCLDCSAAHHRIAVKSRACAKRKPASREMLQPKRRDLRERVLLRDTEDKLRAARTSTGEEDNKDEEEINEVQHDSPESISVLAENEEELPASSQRSSTTTSASAEASDDDECVPDEDHIASSGVLDSSWENPVTLELQTDDFLLDGGCEVVTKEQGSLLEEVLSSLKGPLVSGLVLESEATAEQMEVEDTAGEDVLDNLDVYTASEHPESTDQSSVLDDQLPVENNFSESVTLLQEAENFVQEEEVPEEQEFAEEVQFPEEDLQLHEGSIEKEEYKDEGDQDDRKEDVAEDEEIMEYAGEEVVVEQEDESTEMEENMDEVEKQESEEDAAKEADQEEEMLIEDNKREIYVEELNEEQKDDDEEEEKVEEEETKDQSCPLEDEEQEIKLDTSINIESFHETEQSIEGSTLASTEVVNQPEDLVVQECTEQPSFVVMTSLELSFPKKTSPQPKETEHVPEILQHEILEECEDQSTESLQIDDEQSEEVHQEEMLSVSHQLSTSESEAAKESIQELSHSMADDEPVFKSPSRDQSSVSMTAEQSASQEETQSLPSSPLQREICQADEDTTPENPFGVRLRKTPVLHRYASEGETPTPNTEPVETPKSPFLEQLSRKPVLPKKPDQVTDGVVKPKRTSDLAGKASVESSESPSWISLARQKQKVFKESSLDESLGESKEDLLDDLSGPVTKDQLKPVASPVKVSCSLEISKPVLVEKEKRNISHPVPAPLTQDEPPWLALAKKKAKAWSEMPQIVQ
ncbi:capping protein-inhibiting regulator of actin dynamics isoform X2 [Hemibagrus wyckioides]|uniref:capping protein-inhibiting regulator of actin dynamics isoform X2 n=2 Tax=Hemibagrus wyckioides TaxID=337641 RepID=UPI00266CF421|nr:capping protein-inhibiting regulator of actin dynamics isoform X2 [Hemibagrus wyckioides]